MNLSDDDLDMIAKHLGIGIDALSRKLRRMPSNLRQATALELDDTENLLRRVRDEQRERRELSA